MVTYSLIILNGNLIKLNLVKCLHKDYFYS